MDLRRPDGRGDEIMIQAFRTQWRSDITVRSELSRRTLLGGLAAVAATATGLARGGRAFASAGLAITPFRYRAPASALDGLKRRLAQTRWPDPETVADWSQGVLPAPDTRDARDAPEGLRPAAGRAADQSPREHRRARGGGDRGLGRRAARLRHGALPGKLARLHDRRGRDAGAGGTGPSRSSSRSTGPSYAPWARNPGSLARSSRRPNRFSATPAGPDAPPAVDPRCAVGEYRSSGHRSVCPCARRNASRRVRFLERARHGFAAQSSLDWLGWEA
jgi:hypothetical protein